MRSPPRLHTPRDRDYLRWRYAEIPGVDYRSLWAAEGEEHLAIILRTRLRRSMREVVLSEILGRGGTRGAEPLATLVDRLREQSDIDYLVAAAPKGSPEAGWLRADGFKRMPLGPVLLVRPLAGSRFSEAELTGDRWQLSAGDLEIF